MSEKSSSTKFSQPLELSTPGRPKLVFRSLDELQEWFTKEETAWRWLAQSGPHGAKAWAFFTTQRQNLGQHLAQVQQEVTSGHELTENHEQNLRQALAQPTGLLASDSESGRFILGLAQNEADRPRAGAALALLLRVPSIDFRSPDALRGVVSAVLLEEGITPEAPKAAKAAYEEQLAKSEADLTELRTQHAELLGEIEGLRESAEKLLESQTEKHSGLVSEFAAASDESLAKTTEDLDALKHTYDAELALRAPVTYWSRKRKKHRDLAVWFAVASGVGLAAAVWGLIELVNVILPADPKLGHVAALALIAAPLLWAVRVLVRNLLSNTHLATDAGEREVLIQTYLALVRKGFAKQEDLQLVLQAIFRPTSTGLVKDDAAPPSWWSFITKDQ